MRIVKRLFAVFLAFIVTIISVPYEYIDTYALDELISLPDTTDVSVTINADSSLASISSYIYGITLNSDIDDVSATVLKQSDDAASSYNWETNYSNTGKSGLYTNDVSLVASYSESNWTVPGMYAVSLVERAKQLNIKVSLVTLSMMGYVANDAMGIVSSGETNRWVESFSKKGSSYSITPDVNDDAVYIDEYVNYLVNTYGTAAGGGINGYFLDSEPDLWDEKYDILDLSPVTPSELIEKSSSLASAIKDIDSRAYIFGPSLSGIEACVNLGGTWSEEDYYSEGYSWFIDYYLGEMKKASEEYGSRLLDVLDIHFYVDLTTPTGYDVLTSTDNLSNAYRMQAVRLLWDSEYSESNDYKQYTPLLPMLQASIRMYYPQTWLSISEYDFGGGDNISGAIAEVDALGTFAEQGVFLACLNPTSEDYSYQKSAINLFTSYDGNGASFGDILLDIEKSSDIMSSVYAGTSTEDSSSLNIIVTNKNYSKTKDFTININSNSYAYTVSDIYVINEDSSDILKCELDTSLEEGVLSFTAEPLSVYLITLTGENIITEEEEDDSELSGILEYEGDVYIDTGIDEDEVAVETTAIETTENLVVATLPDLTETEVVVTTTTTAAITSDDEVEIATEEIVEVEDYSTQESKQVSKALKAIVTMLSSLVAIGIAYILIFDKK